MYRAESSGLHDDHGDPISGEIVPVSPAEWETALKQLKNNRTAVNDGLVGELPKTGHVGLIEAIAAYFIDILFVRLVISAEWKGARLAVILQEGADLYL